MEFQMLYDTRNNTSTQDILAQHYVYTDRNLRLISESGFLIYTCAMNWKNVHMQKPNNDKVN